MRPKARSYLEVRWSHDSFSLTTSSLTAVSALPTKLLTRPAATVSNRDSLGPGVFESRRQQASARALEI